jgi:TolA-binding protein
MGFLDKIKQQATDVASTVVVKTQETAKTGQLQMQLRSLKSEEKESLADLGLALMALGDIPAALTEQAAAVRDVRERMAAKETEIAEARKSDDTPAEEAGETVESEAEEVVEAPQAD